MKITKMQGLGNDYLYLYGEPVNAEALSVKLSDRHFGIGSDGMIWISDSDKADFKMRIFNADGSEAKMCGNGIRCVGKYVYDKGYTDKTRLNIETLSGIKYLDMKIKDGKVNFVTVDMGKTEVGTAKEVSVLGRKLVLYPVSVGNPHAVIFVDDMEKTDVAALGRAVETLEMFPDGVNVEFVKVIDDKHLRMRVWERGSAITLACGTGTCAAVSAAVERGICEKNETVSVTLDGGELNITLNDEDHAIMEGPAEFVFECEVDVQ